MATAEDSTAAPAEAGERDKRRQILEGARRVFLAEGYSGASMGEIARVAGVSKGTLYVYFENKEALFAELMADEHRQAAEYLLNLDGDDEDIEVVLRRVGANYVKAMIRPSHIALLRVIMSASERFPEVGRTFLKNGPCVGNARISAYLERQVKAGKLVIDDIELAGWQFLVLCSASIHVKTILSGDRPAPERIDYVVSQAVKTFLAAYGTKH